MAAGMWCTWHFSAKGQFSGRRCQRAEQRVRSWLLVPTLIFPSLSLTLHLSGTLFLVTRSLYLLVDLSILDNPISLLCPSPMYWTHQPFSSNSLLPVLSLSLHLADSAVLLIEQAFRCEVHRIWLVDDKTSVKERPERPRVAGCV